MKLSLFLLGLIISSSTLAQGKDPVGDLIDRLNKEDAAKAQAAAAAAAAKKSNPTKSGEEAAALDRVSKAIDAMGTHHSTAKPNVTVPAKPGLVLDLSDEAAEAAKAARQKMLFDQAYASSQSRTVSQTVSEAQARVQPASQRPCPVPSYKSVPYNEAEQDFFEQGFVGPKNGEHFTMPQVSSVDFSNAAPNATHELNITVAVQAGAGWTVKDVDDTLAKTAAIYAQCGIRLRRATVVLARFPLATDAFTKESEKQIAKAMPSGATKPWLFFMSKRSDKTASESGGSIAYDKGSEGGSTLEGSVWIGRDSLYTNGKLNGYGRAPELVVGHELAHLLTNGDHLNEVPNILSGDGNKLNANITPGACEKMRANSKLLRKL